MYPHNFHVSTSNTVTSWREEIFKLPSNCRSLTVISVIMSSCPLCAKNTACLILEQQSCYIKAIYHKSAPVEVCLQAPGGQRRVIACSRSVWDLLLSESDPSAWPLSQTQQASGTYTHLQEHVQRHKFTNTRMCLCTHACTHLDV